MLKFSLWLSNTKSVGLRDLAASKFKDSAEANWSHPDFAQTISIVYNSTPEDVTQLRNVVANILSGHFEALKNKAEIETVICDIPRLAYALLKRSRESPVPKKAQDRPKKSKKRRSSLDYCADCDEYLEDAIYGGGGVFCPMCEGFLEADVFTAGDW